MKQIQYLSIGSVKFDKFECSFLASPKALDSFEINIIDFRDNSIWNCGVANYLNYDKVEAKQDLSNLNDMIINSHKCKQLVILPCNKIARYQYAYGEYCRSEELKNNINFILSMLKNYTFAPSNVSVGFEPNVTLVGDKEIESDFYFKNIDATKLTMAKNTNKTTTIQVGQNVYLTFVQLTTQEDIIKFLEQINLLSKKEEYPDWLRAYEFNDDKNLLQEISNCKENILTLESKIKDSNTKLNDNLYYKSMLIETGDKLVEIVFKTLQEILGVDLSHFVDEKKEDVLFKKDSITYIGEIKGINGGIGNSHISQVDNHKSLYEDKLQNEGAPEETIKKLLIINDQRNKPLSEREPIHQNQINKANKEDVLIIRTSDLLILLERFRQSKITRDVIFEKFKTQTGQIQY